MHSVSSIFLNHAKNWLKNIPVRKRLPYVKDVGGNYQVLRSKDV